MRRPILVSLFCVAIAVTGTLAFAFPPNTVKVNPFGVDYPLIRPLGYPTREADPYERSFGVRRWLNPAGQETNDFKKTIQEAYNMFDLYGGYGVLGHGEGVFTSAAERWRRNHRGR
ncbi:MAG: hypothetical protein RDU20_12905 [Desulfomonilaceae bacterium]|nr:hypothetical protein [Desulfomonilaceae bacterium]